jgi:serine/threonine protein kinase
LESQPPVDAEPQPTQPSPPATPSGFVPPTAEALAERFPQLEILELIGRGGMGAVYKARQKELDRLVAVKILPPEVSADPAFAERFTREARALARLSHPNIVAVYDFGRTGDGQFYFVMEYVDGVNLRQAIQSGGMTPKEALAIVPQICDALQFAHDEGIVHRDIKPENILVDKRGRVKIADFGLAKLLGHVPGDVSLTGTQQVMGTLRYMAPEQMEGTKAVDHRADIYSLGVVFYELLTGELPIGRFAPPSKKVEIDVRLDEVVLRALEKEPEQRYQHASEVKTEVELISSTSCPLVPSPAPAVEIPRDRRGLRARARLPVKLAVWTAIVVVGWLFLHIAALAWLPSDSLERHERTLRPQSGAYPDVRLRATRRLWHWGSTDSLIARVRGLRRQRSTCRARTTPRHSSSTLIATHGGGVTLRSYKSVRASRGTYRREMSSSG